MAIVTPTRRVESGLALKLARIRAGVRGLDMAARMGVGHSRISAIEKLPRVRPELARRYLAALAEAADTAEEANGRRGRAGASGPVSSETAKARGAFARGGGVL